MNKLTDSWIDLITVQKTLMNLKFICASVKISGISISKKQLFWDILENYGQLYSESVKKTTMETYMFEFSRVSVSLQLK